MRLIDAYALLKSIAHHSISDCLNDVTFDRSIVYEIVKEDMFKLAIQQPIIDAVPVVRCKECIHRGYDACPMCHDEYYFDEDDGADFWTVDNTDDDGFCHKGAKMDGGAEDAHDC